jgi:hypothetical protein
MTRPAQNVMTNDYFRSAQKSIARKKNKAISAGEKSNQWVVYAHLGLDLISTKKNPAGEVGRESLDLK